jgi:putative transposase
MTIGVMSLMARKVRVQYPGAIYHVMNRGDRRNAIFEDDGDRQRFLDTLGEACDKTDWQVHALCLMCNHFHMVVETPNPNLVRGMKWFLGTYTTRFNRRHKEFGHLFSGRYKALIVDGSDDGYLRTVCDYVHLNPARANLVSPDKPLRSYRWSSWPEYLKRPGHRPRWLRVDRLLGEYHVPKDSASGRRHLEDQLEERRLSELRTEYRKIRRGWCFGDEAFRKELCQQMAGKLGPEHYGEERVETEEAMAEAIVERELRRLKWNKAQLEKRAKGDRLKVRMAAKLREESTMTVDWIAKRLSMGTAGYLNNRLYRWRRGVL